MSRRMPVCTECGCICGHFNGCPETPEPPDDDDSTQDGCEEDSTEEGCNETEQSTTHT